MKRLLMVMVAVLVFATVAAASTVSVSFSPNNPYTARFTAPAGPVSAWATVSNPKRNDLYQVQVFDDTRGLMLCDDVREVVLEGPGPVGCSATTLGGDVRVLLRLIRSGGTRSASLTITP